MTPQRLDAGPRGAAGLEAMAALSTGGKQKISFFKGDDAGTHIGSHTVHDFSGAAQSVGVVQTWNQCHEMLLTSDDNPNSIIVMDTEVGATKAELTMRRQQKNWKLQVDSILPQQKFEQYKSTKEFSLYGLGDGGKTVFFLNHDSRAGENVEEFVCAPTRTRCTRASSRSRATRRRAAATSSSGAPTAPSRCTR